MPQNIDKVIMHDWWLYLTATCFGEVYYDQNSYIRYRQHGSNTSGAIVSKSKLLGYRMKQFFQPRGEIYRQNEEFLATYKWKLKERRYLEEYYLLIQILRAEKGYVTVSRLLLIENIFVKNMKMMLYFEEF